MVSRIFNRGSDLERYRLSILHSRGNGNKKVGEKSEVDEVNRVPSNTSSLTTTLNEVYIHAQKFRGENYTAHRSHDKP